jgi:predicted DNA-binding protein
MMYNSLKGEDIMQRTNVYLSDEQVQLLKHLAAEDRQSMATLVREAVDTYLAERLAHDQTWDQRLTQLLERVRERVPASTSSDEIEADITAARQDARAARRR